MEIGSFTLNVLTALPTEGNLVLKLNLRGYIRLWLRSMLGSAFPGHF